MMSLAVMGVLMAALFLAHGLECAAILGHGPAPMTSTLLAPAGSDPAMSDGVMQHATAPDASELTVGAASATDQNFVGGHDMLVRAGAVCVAILLGAGIWLLGRRRPRSICHSVRSWLSGRTYLRLLAVIRWRLSAPDLAVLCVLRT